MAKRQRDEEREERRLSRKEVLLARRQRERNRQVRIAVGLIVGLLALVAIMAVVMEGVVRPAQAVARVGDTEITLRQWQERVRFQRAQFIIALEDQLEAFGGDVGLVQQFNQQQMSLLLQPELLGELILEQMVDEEIVREQAAVRGITVPEEELQQRIEEGFSYFGGESPTPFPTPTQTIAPTPSLTPIPTSVITEEVAAPTLVPTATAGPTMTPFPTATPVSEQAFRDEYNTIIRRFREMGAKEETYREVLRAQMYREKLAEALAEETQMSSEAEHASLYVLTFETAEEAAQAAEAIAETSFLDVWNRIRSLPDDDEAALPGQATELLWQTENGIVQRSGAEIAGAAASLDLNEPSDIIEVQPGIDQLTGLEQDPVFNIIMVSGREVRELPESTLENQRFQLVSELVETRRELGDAELFETWRGHAPTQPVLDPLFRQQPTPAPTLPATPAPADGP
jgi:hypothetical protein